MGSIVVDSSYDGPHLNSDWTLEDPPTALVTMDFVHAMMERFRDQKLVLTAAPLTAVLTSPHLS